MRASDWSIFLSACARDLAMRKRQRVLLLERGAIGLVGASDNPRRCSVVAPALSRSSFLERDQAF